MRRFLLYALPPIAYAAVIFALSSRTISGGPDIPGLDKVVHFTLYGGLALLCARAVNAYVGERLKAAYAGVVLALLYGISDEVHQSFTPGRQPDVYDWVADTLGAIVFVTAWYGALRLRDRQGSPE